MVAPGVLLPVIRLLANWFPGQSMTESREAFETLYDASDALIEVSFAFVVIWARTDALCSAKCVISCLQAGFYDGAGPSLERPAVEAGYMSLLSFAKGQHR